jgi:metal-dependent amidase/aminoacylase/carboxypeptidase family protein
MLCLIELVCFNPNERCFPDVCYMILTVSRNDWYSPWQTTFSMSRITIKGRGGHASQPHRCIDPIVLAASTIMHLQTIPSREVNPSDLAVVTMGSIHAGDAENIIPEQADLKINVRTTDPQTCSRVLASITRIINAEADARQACKSINSTQINFSHRTYSTLCRKARSKTCCVHESMT